MRIKKNMTERALLANRANGKKNPGPRNTDLTRWNAVTHGLLSRKIIFANEDDKRAYDAVVEELYLHCDPQGPIEAAQVSLMAIALLKLSELYGWEYSEICERRSTAAALLKGFEYNFDAQTLSMVPVTQGSWQPRELVVRAGTQKEEETTNHKDREDKGGHTIIEARMSGSPDLILRYQSAILRDFYRALGTLRKLQRERLGLERVIPANPDGEVDDAEE